MQESPNPYSPPAAQTDLDAELLGLQERQDAQRLIVALGVFSRNTLVEFWKKHPDAEQPLRLWFSMVERATWSGPARVREVFGSADFVANNRIVFNIKGNAYRLVALVKYAPLFLVFIRFVGTHADCDRIDANKV